MRVFVLGAGASHHAGYPLAAEIGNSLAAWIETLPSDHQCRDSLTRIIDVYGARDDFEKILADLITRAPGSPAARLREMRHSLLINNLQDAITEHFQAIRSAPTVLYDRLARIIKPGDAVITFNYDLAVERALRASGLWDITTGYGFTVGPGHKSSPVEVLKLHGSTNWRALLFGGLKFTSGAFGNSLGHRPVLCFQPDHEYVGCPDFIDPQLSGRDGVNVQHALIMPALPKEFYFETVFGLEWKPFWDSLWERAEEAITKADHIVVIGYSLPRADERARSLILHTCNKGVRLTICCGGLTMSLEREFRSHNFSRIESFATTFEAFLVHEEGKGPEPQQWR